MKNYRHLIVSLLIITAVIGSPVLADQEADTPESKTIAVQSHEDGGIIIDTTGPYTFNGSNFLIVGAAQKGYGASAVSQISFGGSGPVTKPIAYEKVSIKKSSNQPNPLYDQQIRHLLMTDHFLFVVTEDKPGTVYCYRKFATEGSATIDVLALADEYGNPCAIEQLWYGGGGSGYLFASVSPLKDAGQRNGPALAMAKIFTHVQKKKKKDEKGKEIEGEEEEIRTFHFDALDATTGKIGACKALSLTSILSGTRQDALDTTSTTTQATDVVTTSTTKHTPAPKPINQGADILAVNDVVWNGRLYVGLTVQSKGAWFGSSAAHAVLVGRFDKDKDGKGDALIFEPFAPDAVCAGNTHIIGATGSGTQVAAHAIRPMKTSTKLNYLITVGGVGSNAQTKGRVNALPVQSSNLASSGSRKERIKRHGTLACRDAQPCVHADSRLHVVHGRTFEHKALQPNDAPEYTDAAVCVGGQAQLPGPVSDIRVSGDAVFATVAAPDANQVPGVFYSQALFDAQGKIAVWTPWRLTAGAENPISDLYISVMGGLSMVGPCGQHKEKLHFFQSGWYGGVEGQKNHSKGLEQLLAQLFPQDVGGIQGIFDIPSTTVGLGGNDPVSWLVATGYKRVLLAQTSRPTEHGPRWYTGAYENTLICNDGTFNGLSQAEKSPQAIICSGGALDTIGPIASAHVASNGSDAWLFVGGSRGLAVAALPDGSGWSAQQAIGNYFKHLSSNMTFKTIGSYKFVRKIMSDDQYLYVLTSDSLVRIPLCSSNFADDAQENKCTLATSQDMGQVFEAYVFVDACVSHGTVILATSKGVLATQQGVDVRGVKSARDIEWYKVALPMACEYITKLIPVTFSGHEHDLMCGGQLYVLSSSLHANFASITRLYLDDSNKAQPIGVVPDCYKKDRPSPWILYSSALSGFTTDGCRHIVTGLRHGKQSTHVAVMSGARSGVASGYGISLPLLLNSVNNIAGTIRSSISGTLIVATDGGVRIHE